MGTHTVSTCAAMRFLVLVVCFITLSVVHGTNGNLVDHDSKSLGLEQAEESPQLPDSIEELPALEADDEGTSIRTKSACKKLSGRCLRKRGAFKCSMKTGYKLIGGRKYCGRGRMCCYL